MKSRSRSGGIGRVTEEHEAVRPVEVEETFERTVAEGRRRLSRRWAPLIATGLVGGTDVATGGGGLNHAVVGSLFVFTGLHTSVSPYGYLDGARSDGWAALGNIVGGVGLVTVLRLQVPHRVHSTRAAAPGQGETGAGGADD